MTCRTVEQEENIITISFCTAYAAYLLVNAAKSKMREKYVKMKSLTAV